MEYTNLAPDLKISRIVTGLWQVADMERTGDLLDMDRSCEAMKAYVDAGYTSFDLADHYGSAEDIVGAFKRINPLDGNHQMLTKWVPEPAKITKRDVKEAVTRSLQRMNTEQLDLLQFHAWTYAHPYWMDALIWLQDLKNEGLIKHLGVTNFDTAHMRIALTSGIDLVSNQVSYSLLDQRAKQGMKELSEKFGFKLITFGTLAGGFLNESWLGVEEPNSDRLSTWSLMKYKRFIDQIGGWQIFQELLQCVHAIAQKYDVSIANVVSRYMLDQPEVGGITIGARLGLSEHMEENLNIFKLTLTDEDHESINKALAGHTPIPGDCGDEYRKPPYLTASGDLSHHIEGEDLPYDVVQGDRQQTRVFSKTVWEDLAGYCRAMRSGKRIYVSGTTATHKNRLIGEGDPVAQAHFIIDKIEGSIKSLGGVLEDTVRTRVYVNSLDDWEPVARAHGERFHNIQPANTMVEARIIGAGNLVEIEAEAFLNR